MPWDQVLCVAEKPSISRSITDILSGGQFESRNTATPWVKNFEFPYNPCRAQFIVTCVAGHITERDFGPEYKSWQATDPAVLFDAPIQTHVAQDKVKIRDNLATQARRCKKLVIWTDCDREGEAIGAEIAEICRASNPQILVKRARFSAIIAQQIHHAAQNTVNLDMAQADAVEARSILDLRIGAAFTRMQTLRLQTTFAQLTDVISYGPCQFPTLGFVVSRYELVKSFTPEPFWYIYLALTRRKPGEDEMTTEFTWSRGRLFEFDVSLVIYEGVLASPMAQVTSVRRKAVKKWKPLPLTTVELQKSGSRLLKLAPKRILDISDSLYQKGFLSYPRTETDQFDGQFDFHQLIAKQEADTVWGQFAANLSRGDFSKPRNGKKNDQAHPPIHPTAHVNNLTGDDKRVYEYVTRRFLACCSKDAEGFETIVELACGGEEFSAKGIVVTQRNYLDVFPYDKWNTKPLPDYQEGERFMPSVCELREGETSRPALLTEADLVGLMDKNGIGTDATIAQHIQTIIDRKYVTTRADGATKYLIPSTLGTGLIEGYNAINFDKSLSKPQLRRDTERCMVQVCLGAKSKQAMLTESIQQYKEVFNRAATQFGEVINTVRRRLAESDLDLADEGLGRMGERNPRRRGAPASRRVRRGARAPNEYRRQPRDGSDTDPDDDMPRPQPAAQRNASRNRSALVSANNANRGRAPNCHCGVPAVQLSVTREIANKGRKFWSCGKDRSCEFFEWSEEGNGAVAADVSSNGYRQNAAAQVTGAPATCLCDMTPALRTVVKEGPNQGREFWICPNSEKARCKFFEWKQGPETQGVPGTIDPLHRSTSQTESVQSNKRARMSQDTSNTNDNGARGSCYRCGQDGHWQSSCPNANAGATGNATGRSNEPLSSGNCFKCGEEGHWSNACSREGEAAPGRPSSSSRGRGRAQGRKTSNTRVKRKTFRRGG